MLQDDVYLREYQAATGDAVTTWTFGILWTAVSLNIIVAKMD